MFIAMLVVGLVLAMALPALAVSKAREEIKEEKGSYTDVLKIKFDHPGNPDCLYINTNVVIYDGEGYLHGDNHFRAGEHPEIFKDMFAIPGITEVGMKPRDHKYAMSIEKGECFTFEKDIIPRIIAVLKKHYGYKKDLEILPTEDNRENARLHAEAERDYMERTGRSMYDIY